MIFDNSGRSSGDDRVRILKPDVSTANILRGVRLRLPPDYAALIGSMFTSGSAQLLLVGSGICAARILGVHDRGQLALFNLLPLILTIIGALGVPVAATFFIARDPCGARAILHTVRRIAIAQTLVVGAIQTGVLIVLYRSATPAVQIAAASSLLLGPAKLAQDYGNCILQGERRYKLFNITRAAPNLLYTVLVVGVFIVGGGHLLAVTLCYVLAVTSAAVLTLTVALRQVPPNSRSGPPPPARKLLRFGVRALLGAVYPTEAFQLDQALVGALLSRVALGTYTVGVSFSNLPRFMAQSIGLVAFPNVASTVDRHEARQKVWRFFLLGVLVSAVICGVLELAAPWLIPFLFGRDFRRSVGVTQILLVSAFIVSIRRVLSDSMRGAGFPELGSLGEAVGLALLVPALVILIPLDGLTGAALAMPIAASGGFAVLLIGAVRASTTDKDGIAPLR